MNQLMLRRAEAAGVSEVEREASGWQPHAYRGTVLARASPVGLRTSVNTHMSMAAVPHAIAGNGCGSVGSTRDAHMATHLTRTLAIMYLRGRTQQRAKKSQHSCSTRAARRGPSSIPIVKLNLEALMGHEAVVDAL